MQLINTLESIRVNISQSGIQMYNTNEKLLLVISQLENINVFNKCAKLRI